MPPKLERCINYCCLFVDGREVTREVYEEAVKQHPGSFTGIKPGGRNAIVETIISCRRRDKPGQ